MWEIADGSRREMGERSRESYRRSSGVFGGGNGLCEKRENWVLLLEREGTLSALDQQDSKLQKGETGDELRRRWRGSGK